MNIDTFSEDIKIKWHKVHTTTELELALKGIKKDNPTYRILYNQELEKRVKEFIAKYPELFK